MYILFSVNSYAMQNIDKPPARESGKAKLRAGM